MAPIQSKSCCGLVALLGVALLAEPALSGHAIKTPDSIPKILTDPVFQRSSVNPSALSRLGRYTPALSLRGGAPDVFPVEQLPMPSADSPKLQVVFVSAEIAPWSITGGLGAVCDGLPRAMAKQGHRVMSIAPRYDQYHDAWDTEFTAQIPLGEQMTTVRFFHAYKKGVDRVFVDHPIFLEKVRGLTKTKLYGPKWGVDYEDNQLRFSMFCKAAIIATRDLPLGGFPYGEEVTFVANDWHACLVPTYLKAMKDQGAGFGRARAVVLIHNIVYQGRFPYDKDAAKRLGLPEDYIELMKTKQSLKVGRQKKPSKGLKETEEIPNPAMEVLNLMNGACMTADSILTVSPGYAKEVSTDKAKSAEMMKFVQNIKGILNGVEDTVGPMNEEMGLEPMYDINSLELKAVGKRMMQETLGFEVSEEIPMFVFMGRLDAQKGIDVLFVAMEKALDAGVNAQFVTMGSGIEELEVVAAEMEEKFPNNFKAILSFKGKEKYKSYAAADFALMPSRYEPCGLVQMEGMRFATIPIVAPTGGLADTVSDGETGFVMDHELDADDIEAEDVDMIVENIQRAVKLWGSKAEITRMRKNAMTVADEYSWTNAAKAYIKHFLEIGSPLKP